MSADEELRASLREPHDESRARRNWDAIERKRHRTPHVPMNRGPVLGGLALGVVVAAVAFASFVARDVVPGPLRSDDGRVASGAISRETLSLDDGSRVSLEPGTRLEILENAGDRVRFWLRVGSAGFDVVPHGPRRWVIETGLVTVEVLGTAFRVEHLDDEVRVTVERGTVLVRGPTVPEGMRRLGAGDSIAVPAGERPIAETEPERDVLAAAGSRAEPTSTSVATRRSGRAASIGRSVERSTTPEPGIAIERGVAIEADTADTAGTGSEPDALDVTATAGDAVPDAEHGSAIASEVAHDGEPDAVDEGGLSRLRAADALRARGDLDAAVTLLDAIANDPTAGSERALAAFTRGRIEIDRRHRPRAAADAFTQAIALGLRAPLVEDARARRVEALSRVPDPAAARSAAYEYVTHHPDGRWRREVERWSAAP